MQVACKSSLDESWAKSMVHCNGRHMGSVCLLLHIQVCLGEYLDGCTGGCPTCPVCQQPLTVNLSAPTLVRMEKPWLPFAAILPLCDAEQS